MNEKLKKAILNSNDLYKAVFAANSVNFERRDAAFYTIEKTPPLYSNLVTLSADWRPGKTFDAIDANFKRENWPEWSIKDSFQNLDLRPHGFEKLFDAQWFYLKAANFTPRVNSIKIEHRIIDDEKMLAEWRIAWGKDEKLGKQIFQDALLNRRDFHFIAGYRDEKIVSGCIFNKTADVFGISNFFAPDQKIEYWSEIIKFAHAFLNFPNIVGYERIDFVSKLQALGFESIGDLSVWLKMRATEK